MFGKNFSIEHEKYWLPNIHDIKSSTTFGEKLCGDVQVWPTQTQVVGQYTRKTDQTSHHYETYTNVLQRSKVASRLQHKN